MSPPGKDKEEVKQEEGSFSSTKPATNAKQPVQVSADAFTSQLAALLLQSKVSSSKSDASQSLSKIKI